MLLIKIVLVLYLLVIFRQVAKIIYGIILGYKLSYYSLYPIYYLNGNFGIDFFNRNSIYLYLKPKTPIGNLKLNAHINNIKKIIKLGLIYDFIVIGYLLAMFMFSTDTLLYSILISCYFIVILAYVFFSDLTDVIGAKYDKRIEFTLLTYLDVMELDKCKLKSEFNELIDDMLDYIKINSFDVNNLWDFINNTKFFTLLLGYKYCGYIEKYDDICLLYIQLILKEYLIIKEFDYRQIPTVNDVLNIYYIYDKDNKNESDINLKIKELKLFFKEKNNPIYEYILNYEVISKNSDIMYPKISKIKYRSFPVYFSMLD